MTNATSATTTQTQPADPMDAAMNPSVGDRTYFGEVTTVDVWFCVLQKGVGKVLFDPGQHPIDQRRTAIKIVIVPFKGDFELDQDTIDTAKDWLKHTLPSLRKLNLDLRTLKGRFVQVKRVPTGETYTNKLGETKDRTALIVTAVYPERASCQAAADAFFARLRTSGMPEVDIPEQSAPAAAPSISEDAERQFALQSLPLLWQASGQKADAFHQMIAGNSMMAKFFDEKSPEVCQFTGNTPF